MDKYFHKVPPAQLEQFKSFRQEHPLKKAVVDEVNWEYLTSGDVSGQTILVLPGALSTAESAWRNIIELESRQYRLFVPNYPAELDNMGALADGLAQLLKRYGIHDTYVVGGSYGGMLAQVFTHQYPDMVGKLVLSHTYPPEKRRAQSVAPALRLFRALPMFMVKKMLRDRMTGIIPPKPSPELLLIAAQIRETVDKHFTRQAAINIYLRMMDFDRKEYTPADLAEWKGKTLIMLAEDDPTTPESLRNELIGLYPDATVHMFKGSDKATSILESEEYMGVIEEFFEKDELLSPSKQTH
jgi:pimeloyl-ACP methyl ester carboxylesterase